MKPTPGGAAPPKRRRRLLGAAVALLVLAFLLWALWPRSGSADGLQVTVTASRPWIGQYGRVRLDARVALARSGKAVPPGELSFVWKAGAGVFRGRGAQVYWVAPAAQGAQQLEVTVRRRSGGPAATSSVTVTVRAYGASRGKAPQAAAKGATDDDPELNRYVIDDVELDKQEICANEDVMVKVKARDPGGQTSWLLPVVRFPGFISHGFVSIGRMGASPSLKLADYSGRIQVDLVDGRTSRVVATRFVPLKINRCQTATQGLLVKCGPSELREEVAVCSANIFGETGTAAGDFKPVRYEWQPLDDRGRPAGDPVKTTSKWAQVPVTLRPQASLVDTHVIRARAYDASGQRFEGRGTYLVNNTRFETAEMLGLLQLVVRFSAAPRKDGDTYVTEVELRNPFGEPVALDAVTMTQTPCGSVGPNVLPSKPLGTRQANALFGVSSLGPGESARYSWRLPVDPARCMARAELGGRGLHSGLRAEAVWVMPSGPDTWKKLQGGERNRIAKAMKILSERRGERVTTITQEDLRLLEREGVLERRRPAAPGNLKPGESSR